jgi:hypothetical protein
MSANRTKISLDKEDKGSVKSERISGIKSMKP